MTASPGSAAAHHELAAWSRTSGPSRRRARAAGVGGGDRRRRTRRRRRALPSRPGRCGAPGRRDADRSSATTARRSRRRADRTDRSGWRSHAQWRLAASPTSGSSDGGRRADDGELMLGAHRPRGYRFSARPCWRAGRRRPPRSPRRSRPTHRSARPGPARVAVRPGSQLVVGEDLGDAAGEILGVARFEHQPGIGVGEQLGEAAGARRDEWGSGGERLERDDAERLVQRRDHHHAGPVGDARGVAASGT